MNRRKFLCNGIGFLCGGILAQHTKNSDDTFNPKHGVRERYSQAQRIASNSTYGAWGKQTDTGYIQGADLASDDDLSSHTVLKFDLSGVSIVPVGDGL